jgi:hypothetical protein
VNAHEFKDRLEALRPRFHRYSAHDGIGVMQRYGSILRPAQVGEQVAELLGDPRYMQGVAYGFRNKSDILPLDVTYDPKNTAIPEEATVND